MHPRKNCPVLVVTVILASLLVYTEAFKPCAMSSKYRYPWGLYTSQNGDDWTHAFDIDILYNEIYGFQLEAFPGLTYYCYSKTGYYHAFRSEETTLFGDYKIYVYFCWYFKKVSSSVYNIEEMTEPVMIGSDDHAKAYLQSDEDPERNDICVTKYSSKVGLTSPYKQLRKIIVPTWGKK